MHYSALLKFIGLYLIFFGLTGMVSLTPSLFTKGYSYLKEVYGADLTMSVILWRHITRYIELLIHLLYFLSGVFFLLKKRYSFAFVLLVLIVGVLYRFFLYQFLNLYIPQKYFSDAIFGTFNLDPSGTWGDLLLIIGLTVNIKNYEELSRESLNPLKKNSKYRILTAMISYFMVLYLIHLDVNSFHVLDLVETVAYYFICTILYFTVGIVLGILWPKYSWKSAL